jgi:serine/threonine-protein kinase
MKTFANQLIADKYVTEGHGAQVGMSELWDAQDRQLERPVTIQMLAEKESGDPTICGTFLAHQRIASTIQDGALFAVYDAGIWDGRAYSIMQRFFGVPTGDLYVPGRGPDVPLGLAVTRQVAEVLERCRRAGLTDWAFSPEAVLVDPEGNAHLAIIDGLAAPGGVGDAAALGKLLRLILTGNRDAQDAQLRAALVPDGVIGLLERLQPGRANSISSAGEAAAAIMALEAASTQVTQAYEAGAILPVGQDPPAVDNEAPTSVDPSEAPTLVAPVLPGAAYAGARPANSAPPGPDPWARPVAPATRSFGPYAPPLSSGRDTAVVREHRPAVWLVPLAALLLVLALAFVWLKLLSPATRVEGQVVLPTATPTTAPPAPALVAVPDLRGKSLDEASGVAQASKLSLAQGGSDYNADYAAGHIAAQQPAPGTQVQAGSAITVSLSLGQVPAPPVVSNPPAPAPPPQRGPSNGRGKHK